MLTTQTTPLNLLPYSFVKEHQMLLLPEESQWVLYYHTLFEASVLLEIQRAFSEPFRLEKIAREAFEKKLALAYQANADLTEQLMNDLSEDSDLTSLMQAFTKTEDLLETEDDAPIIRLLNALFTEAIKYQASDIHIETFENTLLVRYRVDGVLRKMLEPPRVLAPMIISRIKVMAKLDIAEKRLPQDGRISLHFAGRNVDIRVSTIPTNHGERVVMRLLDKQQSRLNLDYLGISPKALDTIQLLINKPHGVILITGPTGSGKTTTLYAALASMDATALNILTVEDPVEYELPGIGQTQVNLKADMTFARGLRAILRQDPDVVMIGEIRDLETAEIAVQASLTGHLVLSTLHTNTAIGAVTRLIDLGVPPFLIASTLAGVIAQRLVRLLCQACKKPYVCSTEECELLGLPAEKPPTLYQAMGCHQCSHTGYAGRTGIYEVIMINDTLRSMIHKNIEEQTLTQEAYKTYASLQQDGLRCVLEGLTSLAEVIRVTSLEG